MAPNHTETGPFLLEPSGQLLVSRIIGQVVWIDFRCPVSSVYQACGLFSTTPALNTTAKAARNASRFAGYSAQGRIALTKVAHRKMTKDDIHLLYEYDRWANNRVLQVVSKLTVEQFTRDLGGSFRSVRDTLVHIISGEWGWLAYWKEPIHSSAFLTDLRKRRDGLFSPDAFPNVAAVQLKWGEVEKELIEFVNRLTNESLERMLPLRTTQISLAHLMQHLTNHSTYHRGQVALMMRQLDAEPLATDFHVFLVEGRREAAPAL